MTSSSLRRIIHLVLAAAATDAAIACGGAVTSVGDSTDRGVEGTDPPNPGKPPSPAFPPIETPKTDAGVTDATTDVAKPSDAAPDVFKGCAMGEVAPSPSFCCKDPADPFCGGGGGDGPCKLDCREVCNAVAPGSGNNGSCFWSASASNPKVEYYCGMCGVGRIPAGTAPCERGASVGERLAMQAYYEAASVTAFRSLAEVLRRQGAPVALVRRAVRAAGEEKRHARLFTSLAERRGATVATPASTSMKETPSLFDLAIENAREGCVRETYGALVALHQSHHATHPELRAAFGSVADDEIAHAALSWDLAAWFDSRLSPSERETVSAARVEAVATLREATAREYDVIDRLLGAPSPESSKALFDDLFARITEVADVTKDSRAA